MLVTSRTCQLKWGKPAANALRAGRVLQRRTDIESAQKLWPEPAVSKGARADREPRKMPLRTPDSRAWNAVEFKLTEKISHNYPPPGADSARRSERWCVTMATASCRRASPWQSCDKHKLSEPHVPSTHRHVPFLKKKKFYCHHVCCTIRHSCLSIKGTVHP